MLRESKTHYFQTCTKALYNPPTTYNDPDDKDRAGS